MTSAIQFSVSYAEVIRMYCRIDPNELVALLNDEDILYIEPLSVDTSPAKLHVPAKQPVNVNPISFDITTASYALVQQPVRTKTTVRNYIGAKPKVPKSTVITFISLKPKFPKSIVKPMPNDTNKEKVQAFTYKPSMSDPISYQLITTDLI